MFNYLVFLSQKIYLYEREMIWYWARKFFSVREVCVVQSGAAEMTREPCENCHILSTVHCKESTATASSELPLLSRQLDEVTLTEHHDLPDTDTRNITSWHCWQSRLQSCRWDFMWGCWYDLRVLVWPPGVGMTWWERTLLWCDVMWGCWYDQVREDFTVVWCDVRVLVWPQGVGMTSGERGLYCGVMWCEGVGVVTFSQRANSALLQLHTKQNFQYWPPGQPCCYPITQ